MRSLLRDHKSAESPPVGRRDAPADAASRINGGLGLPGLAGHGASWVSRPFVVLACSYAVLVALGWLRIATGAEFEFASLGLLLVVAVSWVSGRTAGFSAAAAATGVWLVGDIVAERPFSEWWIPWANATVRLATYGVIASLADLSRSLLTAERERAARDELTGLYNRRAFFQVGSHALGMAQRRKSGIALAFIDLDNFKQLNDTAGHALGDAALAATARSLQASARAADVAARIGGDEFVVLMVDVDRGGADAIAQRIASHLRATLTPFRRLTASVGVAWFQRPVGTLAEMLHSADQLMLRAKNAQKGSVVVEAGR